jgi:hypothetical protein
VILHLGLIPCFFSQKERHQYSDTTKREGILLHHLDKKTKLTCKTMKTIYSFRKVNKEIIIKLILKK